MKKVIEMQYTKSTKGTHVYGDTSDDAPVPTLYIKRAFFTTEPPKTITITIEVA